MSKKELAEMIEVVVTKVTERFTEAIRVMIKELRKVIANPISTKISMIETKLAVIESKLQDGLLRAQGTDAATTSTIP